jgi:hypothetical protein
MVHTIAPAVRRRPTLTGWAVASIPYVVGSAIGGAATGALVGGIGMLLRLGGADALLLLAVFAAVCFVAILRDLLRPTTVLPSLQRQVPARWRASLPLSYATFLYGFQLGLGWATFVNFASYYVLLAAIVVQGSVKYGMIIHASYGVARGAVVLAFPNMSVERTNALLLKAGRLRRHAGWISVLASAVSGGIILVRR